MPVNNFKPILWEKKILREKDKVDMLVKNCTRKWSGLIEGLGSVVNINSVNEPTIGDYVPGVTVITPENIKDENRKLTITESKYFAVKLDKVDKKQATKGLMEEAIRKAAIGLKNVQEQFIASKYANGALSVTQAALTSENFFSTFMKAKRKLMRNNVTLDDKLCAEVSPEVWEKGVLAQILLSHDNQPMINTGQFVTSLGITFYVSTNIPVVETNDDVIQQVCALRTMESIGFAEQIMDIERYKPESSFSEAAKGLMVYGAKVVKPRELCQMDLTTAAEVDTL